MKHQEEFFLKEITDKKTDDPKNERTTFKLIPKNPLICDEVELKVKTLESMRLLGLPETIKDSIVIEFGATNKQTKIIEDENK